MNEYEILLMLDPELAEERQTEIVSRTHELVDKGSGTWLSHDVWGRRRLAYEIDHKADGTYHLLHALTYGYLLRNPPAAGSWAAITKWRL